VDRCAFLLLSVVAFSLTNSTFESGFEQTHYRCGSNDTCPSKFQCVAGFCELAGLGPDGAPDAPTKPGADAGVPTDARPPADAGVATFEDRFDDGALSGWTPWTHPGCTTAETQGLLELTFDGTGEGYCGADTQATFDVRGGTLVVEVAAAPVQSTFEAYVLLFDNQQQIMMIRDTSGLTMQLKSGSSIIGTRTIPNDIVGQRFWRIREQAGTIFWDTSPDGATWTNRHSTPTVIDVSSLQVELAAGHANPGPGQPVVARFDNVAVF